MPDPQFHIDRYSDWDEDLTPERKLERQVLLLVAAHGGGLEAGDLGRLLERTRRDDWSPVYDTTWGLQRRGLLVISPEPDEPEIKSCTYTITPAGLVLVGEIRAQAHTCSERWRKQRPDLTEIEVIDNTGGQSTRTVAWHFHNLVTDSGSEFFATWTLGEPYVRMWSPEGAFRDVLTWNPRQSASPESVQELAGVWGPVGLRIHQHRIYPTPEA
ncbi:hypothetical protein [Streptomyces goshikiensis]